MGLGGISWPQLLIILAIVVVLFGTKRLRGLGGDLGEAIKGFKRSVSDNDVNTEAASTKKVSSEDDATFSEDKEKKNNDDQFSQ